MTIPDVYLIGAPKAGTTSLSRWLSSHPEVHVSDPKETYFWAGDYPRLRAHHGYDTRAAYEALFASPAARAARRRVDGSTMYLYSRVAIATILAEVPDARFVVAIRNPVDLLVSYHRSQIFTLNEQERDFRAAWQRALAGRSCDTALDPKLVDYPLVGSMGAALERVAALVPRDRMHVVLLDDMVTDPLAVWVRLTRFLDIDGSALPDFRAFNVSQKANRYPRLWRLVQRPPSILERPIQQLRVRSRGYRNPTVVALRKRLLWRPDEKPQVTAETKDELRAYFRSDVKLLEHLVGRPLTAWTTPARLPRQRDGAARAAGQPGSARPGSMQRGPEQSGPLQPAG